MAKSPKAAFTAAARDNRDHYLKTSANRVIRAFVPTSGDLVALGMLRARFGRWWKMQLRQLWSVNEDERVEMRRFLIASDMPVQTVDLLAGMEVRGGLTWLASFDPQKPYTYQQAYSDLLTKALADERTKLATTQRVLMCLQAARNNADQTFQGPNAPTDGTCWAYVALDSIRCLPDDMLTKPVVAWFTKRGLLF